MKFPYKQTIILFFFLFLLSAIVGYFYYGVLNLVAFINTSFFFSSIFIFASLLFLVTKNGFFDGITLGFRKIFASRQADRNLEEDIRNEMRPPSELVNPISITPIFGGSLLLFILMLLFLAIYYL